MATLPGSGNMGLQQIITFFGAGGTKLTDFHRGGGKVPATKTTTTTSTTYGTWSAYRFSALTLGGGPDPGSVTDGWILWELKSSGSLVAGRVWSGGVHMGNSTGSSVFFGSTSGFQFERGSFVGSNGDSTYNYYFYNLRSRSFSTTTSTTTTDINLGVPGSGDIKLTDFYGAVDG